MNTGHEKTKFKWVVVVNGQYISKNQPKHPDRPATMTDSIASAMLYSEKPDFSEWWGLEGEPKAVKVKTVYRVETV